ARRGRGTPGRVPPGRRGEGGGGGAPEGRGSAPPAGRCRLLLPGGGGRPALPEGGGDEARREPAEEAGRLRLPLRQRDDLGLQGGELREVGGRIDDRGGQPPPEVGLSPGGQLGADALAEARQRLVLIHAPRPPGRGGARRGRPAPWSSPAPAGG